MDQNPWSIIKRGLTKVINIAQGIRQTKFGSDEYMLLYTTIENCSLIYPHKLLATYKDVVCHAYVNATVLPCLRDSSSELLLSEIVRTFTNHQHVVRRTLRLFGSLDNNPFFPSTDLFKLDGFACFRDVVYRELKSKITNVVVCLIAREREGEQIDRVLLKNVLDIFVVKGNGNSTDNENGLEESILKESACHYLREAASDWMVECSCLDYILKVDECLKREKDLFADYLPRSSQRKLHEIFHRELLAAYATLLENEHKVEDLSTIFQHLQKIPGGLKLVSNNLKLNITSRGTALVKQAEESANNNNNKVRLQEEKRDAGALPEHVFVKELIALHDKFTAYVNVCFQNHHLFHMALKDSFRIICNEGVSGNSSAELFASFCDHILRKGGNEKLISDEAIGDTLEKVVKLLTYISDKDLFAEFYRKRLSRRLLFDKSSNVEHERSILTKMKQEFGVQFTSKMEGMVTDFTLAKENQTKFEEYIFFGHNRNLNPGIDLAVTVLTTGFWPTYKSFDLNLPVEMATCVSVFREFYQTKTKYRKLSFIYSLGTCNVEGRFDQKTIELNVTTYQAATLLLFNASDRLSYREIVTQLNLPDDDVVRLLHSLSCGRYKILSKNPDTKTISPTDTFEYNSKFTDKMRRIKIPLTPVVDEKKKVIEDVCKDRRYTIDASIVRIMKSRKVLSSQKLIAECVEQLNSMFKPDVKAIKERIEDLIVREYLERDKNSSSKFKYLA